VPLTVFDLIDLRSFSSLWYWVLVALTWARVAQAPLGIPYDMVTRAAPDAQSGEDLLAQTGIQLRRRNSPHSRQSQIMVGLWAFVITLLAALSLLYGSELALSLFLLVVPLALVQLLNGRAARDLIALGPDLESVVRRLRRLKRWTQVVALLAVFFTAVIGMFYNLTRTLF